MIGNILKYASSLLLGLVALLEPTLKFAVVLFFAVLLDCYSAFNLSRRLKKEFPDKVSGKFQSKYGLKIFKTFIEAYTVVILLHWVDVVLLENIGYLNLSNFGAAIFCGIQIWSVLENVSSHNGAKWAKIMQKIMVDKAARHFDIDLTNLKEKKDEKNTDTNIN